MRPAGLLALLLWHSVALADDSVRISYHENNYLPDGSDVASELLISRQSTPTISPPSADETDRFFLAIRELLEGANSPPEWGSVGLHQPSVELAVILGERKYLFHASHGTNGPQLWLDPSDYDRQQFDVLVKILHLAADHSSLIFTGRM